MVTDRQTDTHTQAKYYNPSVHARRGLKIVYCLCNVDTMYTITVSQREYCQLQNYTQEYHYAQRTEHMYLYVVIWKLSELKKVMCWVNTNTQIR